MRTDFRTVFFRAHMGRGRNTPRVTAFRQNPPDLSRSTSENVLSHSPMNFLLLVKPLSLLWPHPSFSFFGAGAGAVAEAIPTMRASGRRRLPPASSDGAGKTRAKPLSQNAPCQQHSSAVISSVDELLGPDTVVDTAARRGPCAPWAVEGRCEEWPTGARLPAAKFLLMLGACAGAPQGALPQPMTTTRL